MRAARQISNLPGYYWVYPGKANQWSITTHTRVAYNPLTGDRLPLRQAQRKQFFNKTGRNVSYEQRGTGAYTSPTPAVPPAPKRQYKHRKAFERAFVFKSVNESAYDSPYLDVVMGQAEREKSDSEMYLLAYGYIPLKLDSPPEQLIRQRNKKAKTHKWRNLTPYVLQEYMVSPACMRNDILPNISRYFGTMDNIKKFRLIVVRKQKTVRK